MKNINKNSTPFRIVQPDLWNEVHENDIVLSDFGKMDLIHEIDEFIIGTIERSYITELNTIKNDRKIQ